MSALEFIAAGLAGAAIAVAALLAGVWLCRRVSRPVPPAAQREPPRQQPQPGENPWGNNP